jgi:hypothetical protein
MDADNRRLLVRLILLNVEAVIAAGSRSHIFVVIYQ